MLTREEAQQQLKALRIADGIQRRLDRVAKLPRRERDLARTLLGRDAAGQPLADDVDDETYPPAVEELDELGERRRNKIWQALFPALAPHVEKAWLLQVGQPYLSGYDRRAFRAPNNPRTSRPKRGNWLREMINLTALYDQNVAWYAAWAPHLGWVPPTCLTALLAAAMDGGGKEGEAVLATLCASASGGHPVGVMGRHVTSALLAASRPDGWAFVERLLLAAERQEGLRQVVLETVDMAQPEAYRRMLRLILDHNLTRFAATVRAAAVWFGLPFDVENARSVSLALEQALAYLDDPAGRDAALACGDGQAVYLALWAAAFQDAVAAIEPATRLLADPDLERRFAAAYLLAQVGLVSSIQAVAAALDDPDLRVALAALPAYLPHVDSRMGETDLFERLERLVARLPKGKRELEPILWPWLRLQTDRQTAAQLLTECLGSRPATRLTPYLAMMGPYRRADAVDRLAAADTAESRHTLLELLRDPAEEVRRRAAKGLGRRPVTEEEAPRLEALLGRKAADLRETLLPLLLAQRDDAALASARRLLGAPETLPRQAGLHLLAGLVEAGRAVADSRALAAEHQAGHGDLSATERELLGRLLGRERQEATLDDALGLLDPRQRTQPTPPRRIKPPLARPGDRSLVSEAAVACLRALNGLVHEHRATPITLELSDGKREELLGDLAYLLVSPRPDLPPEQDAARLPLREVWEGWWAGRPPAQRDPDGLELLRAGALLQSYWQRDNYLARYPANWLREAWPALLGEMDRDEIRYLHIVAGVLSWLTRLHPPAGAADFLIDAVEYGLSLIPAQELPRVPAQSGSGPNVIVVKAMAGSFDASQPLWRDAPPLRAWLDQAREHRRLCPESWEARHHIRLWGLLRWMDEPGPALPRFRPPLEDVLAAQAAGGAIEADVLDHLLGPRPPGDITNGFRQLFSWTGRKPAPLALRYPVLQELANRCRRRIVEVETARTDLPTAASAPARALAYAGGQVVLVRLLQAMGNDPFDRGYTHEYLSKISVLSHLVAMTFPEPSDTPEDFAAAVRAAGIVERRLIDLAAYTPQWARFVEHALEWPGFEEAVWWLHAHTKDRRWGISREILDEWKAEIQQRTPLDGEDLLEGATDVAWFWRAYRALGEERWDALDRAAPYASYGAGHKRAQLYADAMRGRLDRDQLLARIAGKRHQDAVRALGLLLLPEGADREAEILARYGAIQEFVRTGAKFGSQRRESEKLAARIALDNLARTAGYPDPQRLQWAMEARQSADLAAGPLTATAGEVTVSLSLDELGQAELTVEKAGKRLKAIPAAAKKDPAVATLQERARALERQIARTRRALEQAMCRGDVFTGAELRQLAEHPVLAPMIRDLVFSGDAAIGYPVERGGALQAHDGRKQPVPPGDRLRLAHPLDLLESGEWTAWQRECFFSERIQPFKQVFRELYVLTEAERAEGDISRRYAGHQVNPRQAQALLAGRGWISHPEEGIYHAYHNWGITAWVESLGAWFTPAEVEGLTIEGVRFARRDWVMPLAEVPPRLFSEVMRDLDLVVSVAHQGGVDPEASASTVELRAALVAETCAALGLDNVRLQAPRTLIEGRLASYSVHLGSAVVHQQPGGQVCIVPVHAQHRGRLFLPFADDDPRSAEILSKILLLARDWEIKDPTILEQIIGRR